MADGDVDVSDLIQDVSLPLKPSKDPAAKAYVSEWLERRANGKPTYAKGASAPESGGAKGKPATRSSQRPSPMPAPIDQLDASISPAEDEDGVDEDSTGAANGHLEEAVAYAAEYAAPGCRDSIAEQGTGAEDAGIKVPRGAILDAWWHEIAPGTALVLLNAVAKAAKETGGSQRVESGDVADLRQQISAYKKKAEEAERARERARDEGRKQAEQSSAAHVADLQKAVARMEKEIASKSNAREDALIRHMETLLGKNASGAAIGAAGEDLVETRLSGLLPDYDIENVSEDRKSMDRMMTHKDGFRAMLEVKTGTRVKKPDRDAFEEAARLNLKGAHAVLLLALKADHVDKRGKFACAEVGGIPVLYISDVLADNWQPVVLALELLRAQHWAKEVGKDDGLTVKLLGDALRDMLALHDDLASARRQAASLDTLLRKAAAPIPRVIENLRMAVPRPFEDQTKRRTKAAVSAAAKGGTASAKPTPSPMADEDFDAALKEMGVDSVE